MARVTLPFQIKIVRRRFLYILLLFCLTAPVLVSYGWLQYQRNLVRKEVKRQMIAGLDEEALVLLKFTETDSKTLLRWEHAHEFDYLGQMFDVVRTETKGDTIYYHCWLDQKESELNAQISQLVALTVDKDPTNQEHQKRLTHFYKSLYGFEPQVLPLFVLNTEAKPTNYPPLFSKTSTSISPGVPPPKVS